MFYFKIWIAFISVMAIYLTVKDKLAARSRRRRVAESTLYITAVFGGSVTMFFTMLLIRHKTRKLKFMLGLPLIAALQAIAVRWFFLR